MKYIDDQEQQSSQSSNQMYQEGEEEEIDEESEENSEEQQKLMNIEMQRIRHQLKNMPYQLILKHQEDVKNGLKKNNQNSKKTPKISKINKKIKKQNKNKVDPQKHMKNEAIQKSIYAKPIKKHVKIFSPLKKNSIDPRFQTFAGNYNPDLAMKSYNFIPQLQKVQIQQLKSKLKNQKKRNKLSQKQREILSKEYNRVTNDFKRGELLKLQKETKKQLKIKSGNNNYHIKKQQFREQFQKKKLMNMSQGDREKKIKEKQSQGRKNYMNERRKTMNLKPKFY